MKTGISLAIIATEAFLPLHTGIVAQDSVKVVILSPKVGIEIDKSEHDHYKLFYTVNDFNKAVFYQNPDETFFARIEQIGADGSMRDTTISYNKNFLLMLAERTNHFDDLIKGKYQMGQEPARLQVVDIEGNVLRTISREKMAETPGSAAGPYVVSDLLPFAAADARFNRERYPEVGFGIGFSTYSPDITNIEPAFSAIENKYRNRGYPMGHFQPDFDFSRLLWYHVNIRCSRTFSLLLEQGSSINSKETRFWTISASVLYRFQFVGKSWFRPFAGAGIGRYHFKIKQNYSDRISEVGEWGSYTYLESITSEGGCIGYSITGGIELADPAGLSLSLYGNYLLVPVVEEDTPENGKASIKLGSIAAGARISLYF